MNHEQATRRKRKNWPKCPNHPNAPGLDWWCGKIQDSCSRRVFGSGISPLVCRMLSRLSEMPERQLSKPTLGDAATSMGVPQKFFSRVLGATNGLVTLDALSPVVITFHDDVLLGHKVPRVPDRRPPALRHQLRLKKDSKNRCGVCGKTFPPGDLDIHHVIPLAILGADEPGNWVPACHTCQKTIWSGFDRTSLRYYRQERVDRFGIRFIGGKFWPVINGRVRRDTRESLDD